MNSALPKTLGDGLTLRAVSSTADVQRYIDLSARVTNEGEIVARLLHHRPTTTHADYWLVVDEATGAAVSTTCLLPWRCVYDGIPLQVAMLEMVVTDPAYRQRGLVRKQIEHFHAVVAERGFDLSIIQGIPYYYRQYGYSYALDHTPLTALAAWRILDAPTDIASPYQIRAATVDDVAALTRLYQAAMTQHQIVVERSAADWHYLLQHKGHQAQLVVERETGRRVGYFVPAGQGAPLRLYEHAVLDYGAGLAILQALKQTSGGEVQIAGPAADRLVALARTLGGVGLPVADQWLWRIPDLVNLLNRLAPLLARRLVQAGCRDFSGTLRLNLYRQAYAFQINRGQIVITGLGFVDASMGADGGDLCIPPEAFMRLLLGYRSLEQLRDSWPDIGVKAETRYLIEALFPGLTAHLVMPY